MKELKKAQMGIITVLALLLVSMKRRLPEARRLSSGTTTLALAGIVLLVAAGGASAADCSNAIGGQGSCNCGDTVVGDYTFTGDMVCTNAAQNGLIIGASGITIDGAGHKMTGNVSHATCTGTQTAPCETHSGVVNVNGSCDNVVVKNLEIENFCTGVVIGTSGVVVEYMNVTSCKIHDCGKYASTHGIHLVGANYCNMSRNEIYNIDGEGIPAGCGGGGNGIFMHGGQSGLIHGDYNTVTCNYVHNTNKSGIFSKYQCRYCDVSYNNASDNPEGGIVPMCKKSNDWTIEYNNMSNNGLFGLKMQASDNTLRYNTILNNGWYGIWIVTEDSLPAAPPSHGTGNDVLNNTLCGNPYDDIHVSNNDGSNDADSNTCDTSTIGGCDWSCDNLVSVYYDYDEDGRYSKDSADCPCVLPGGGKCACCNPGLFNGSADAKASYEASCDCQWTPGLDLNDCLAELPYYCDYDNDGYFSADSPGSAAELPSGCQWDAGDDCNDANPDVNPGAAENCTDGIDNDCDELVDGEDPDCFPNKVYFMPEDIRLPKQGNTTNVSIWIDTSEVLSGGIVVFDYTCCCANVTAYYPNTTYWNQANNANIGTCGTVTIGFSCGVIKPGPGLVHIGDFTIECCGASYCETDLVWNTTLQPGSPPKMPGIGNLTGDPILVNWKDGTFKCNIPDLVVTMVKTTEIPGDPSNYTVECTVKNKGDVDADGSHVSLAVDGDPTSTLTEPVGSLGPGNSTIIPFGPITLSGTVDELLVCADCNNEVVETDETNNCRIGRYPGEVVISIQPVDTFVQPQDQFDVKVYVDTKEIEVYAVQYRLTYNTSVVRAETQNKDSFLGSIYETIVLVNEIDQPHGEAFYAETRKDVLSGVTTNDNVTNVHFIAIGVRGATTDLTLDDIIISNADGVPIEYRIENGAVEITTNTAPVANGTSKHRTNNVAQKYQCISTLCSCSYDLDYPGKGGNISYIRWAFGDGQYGTSEGLPVENCTCKEHKYESWQWNPLGDPNGDYVPFDVQLDVMDDGCPEITNSTNFTINVYIAGDANGDGEVNVLDAVWVGNYWREECDHCQCEPCYGYLWDNERADGADLNNDCEINVLDAVIIGANWRHVAW